MPSSVMTRPVKTDAAQSQQEREFDRWRVAAELIKRMQEAGIGCELLSVSHLDKQ
jgi:hypothetical protein